MNQDLPSPSAGAGTTTPEGASSAVHRAEASPGAAATASTQLSALNSQPPPPIPDHELLRSIGHGSYCEVWLARTVLSGLRAVKIVHRSSFEDDRPFQREFEGLQKFAPISRSHTSQLAILHVGRHEADGCFYYVMELADAVGTRSTASDSSNKIRDDVKVIPTDADSERVGTRSTASVSPGKITDGVESVPTGALDYVPHTLRSELKRHGALPIDRCLEIGLALAEALTHLHQHGLVHRDIKPSNIIFVGGVPKLADIGLVTDVDASRSFVGTEGYLPPEGPGTPQADIYGLGKVLYELCTGKDRKDYPALPPDLRERPASEQRALLELNAVLVKAFATDPRERYQTAQEMAADLALLQRGESVKRKRAAGRLFVAARNSFVALAVVTAIIWGSFHYFTTRKSTLYMPRMSVNGEANDLYYKGLHPYQKEGASTLHQAIQYFQQAIEKHDWYQNPRTRMCQPLPRHREIK